MPSTELLEIVTPTPTPSSSPDVDSTSMTTRQMEKSPAKEAEASDNTDQESTTAPDTSSLFFGLTEVRVALPTASITSSSSSFKLTSSARPDTPTLTDDAPVASGSSLRLFTPEDVSLQAQLPGSVDEHQEGEDVQSSQGIKTAMNRPLVFPLTRRQAREYEKECRRRQHAERIAISEEKKARAKAVHDARQQEVLRLQAVKAEKEAKIKEQKRQAGLERARLNEAAAVQQAKINKAERAERHRLWIISRMSARLAIEQDESERCRLAREIEELQAVEVQRSGSPGVAFTSDISHEATGTDARAQESSGASK